MATILKGSRWRSAIFLAVRCPLRLPCLPALLPAFCLWRGIGLTYSYHSLVIYYTARQCACTRAYVNVRAWVGLCINRRLCGSGKALSWRASLDRRSDGRHHHDGPRNRLVRKTPFEAVFILKTIFLPRQARDKDWKGFLCERFFV